jgi:energy-coupling factor transporter ATP-binding protein EcfA2
MTLVNSLFVPENEVASFGLKEIQMARLGRLVAFAGKNGAGKSRILNRVEDIVQHRYANFETTAALEREVTLFEDMIKQNPGHEGTVDWRKNLGELRQRLDLITNRIFPGHTIKKFMAVRFVPKGLALQDPRQQLSQELIPRSSQAKSPGLNGYEHTCLFHIQHLQTQWWNTSHQNSSARAEDKKHALEEYNGLLKIVQRLLNTSLDRNSDGEPTLFGKPIPDCGLSDGQKIVLQLCTALHAQRADLDNTVFILDEPENHLHPSAAIDLLESLYKATENSQIWIATHSIPLLAYVSSIDPMALWYMEDGAAYHAGRHPEKVLGSLLGTEERLGQLHAFTSLPAQLATLNYASESLLPPKVVEGGANDPQVTQVQKVVARLSKGEPLSMLDFGAGKGRLLDGINANLAPREGTTVELPDYYAFDQFESDREACEAVIATHFAADTQRYFKTPEEFYTHKDDASISVVTMCNVFHEISPSDWLDLFSTQSLISRALKADGYLLIVEDQRIPTGEHAHKYGFIVLDTPHLKTLFSITETDIENELFIIDDHRGDGRLKAHLIAKSLRARITAESRKKAISELQTTAKQRIKELRGREATYANGQLNGFWTQQFANTSLYLGDT